jgi:DNA-binding NarL/FixJ family response regulator
MPVKILIADDHKIVRDGLTALIDKEADFEVVGQAANGRQAVKGVRAQQPDVVIMDLSMPEMNGIDAASEILEEFPQCKIIILSMHTDKRFVNGALQAGVSGFLLKECAYKELNNAVRAVCNNQSYLSPQIAHLVVDSYRQQLKSENKAEALTTKEREVLQLLSEGHQTKEIAEKLHVSVKTIEARRRTIMDKLNIPSVAGLVRYAIREGISEL